MKIKLIDFKELFKKPTNCFAIEFSPIECEIDNKKALINSIKKIYHNSYNFLAYNLTYNCDSNSEIFNFIKNVAYNSINENKLNNFVLKYNIKLKKYNKIILYRKTNLTFKSFTILKTENEIIETNIERKNSPFPINFDIKCGIKLINIKTLVDNKYKSKFDNDISVKKLYKTAYAYMASKKKNFYSQFGITISNNQKYINDNYTLSNKLSEIIKLY